MGSEWAKKLDSPKNYQIGVQHLLNPHQRRYGLSQINKVCGMTNERSYVKSSEDLHEAFNLVQSFRKIMVEKSGDTELKEWIEKSITSGLKEIASFAKGLLADYSAVENALTLLWSDGPVEGNVNRLKTIKRQMYGRAGFDLLRKRVVYAPS